MKIISKIVLFIHISHADINLTFILITASHHHPLPVPAQRVVTRNGMLSGKLHFATPTTMETLLKKEGIVVKDDTIQDFKNKFWDPAKELSVE